MNLKALLAVHNKPWLINPDAAAHLLDVFEQAKAGTLDYKKFREAKESKIKLFDNSAARMSPMSSGQMEDFKGFEGCTVACIPIAGPLMKDDFCGDLGINSYMELTKMAMSAQSVKSIVYIFDSPGGSVEGIEKFATLIKATGKETTAVVDGSCCSAAYWLASCCDKIYASASTDMIGSIGVMCSLRDNTEALKRQGIVIRTYYASASVDKNKAADDAVAGDGKALVEDYLDPLNETFMGTVRKNRGIKEGDNAAMTGKTFYPAQAKENGLIDGMKSLDAVVTSAALKGQTFLNNKVMTAAEYKAAHPNEYATILAEGAKAERERVEDWNEWVDIDAEGVKAGIASGKPIDRAAVKAFNAKAVNKSLLQLAKAENADPVTTADPGKQSKLTATQKERFIMMNEQSKAAGEPPLTEAEFITRFGSTFK